MCSYQLPLASAHNLGLTGVGIARVWSAAGCRGCLLELAWERAYSISERLFFLSKHEGKLHLHLHLHSFPLGAVLGGGGRGCFAVCRRVELCSIRGLCVCVALQHGGAGGLQSRRPEAGGGSGRSSGSGGRGALQWGRGAHTHTHTSFHSLSAGFAAAGGLFRSESLLLPAQPHP